MTTPVSGQISMSQVNTELGIPSNTQNNFNNSLTRALAFDRTVGAQISMSQMQNKSQVTVTIVNDGSGVIGFDAGFLSTAHGTVAPATLKGSVIDTEADAFGGFYIQLHTSPLASTFFTQVYDPRTNTQLASAAATFASGGGISHWQWPGTIGFVGGNTDFTFFAH